MRNSYLLLLQVLLGAFLILGGEMAQAACTGIYNHQFTTLQGEKFNLCEHQHQPILVVNTASKCGFTPQFEKLEAMYKDHNSKGLIILGFPSNDFRQELSSNKEIGDFCKMTYAVKFPMMAKSSVTGAHANPFYKELTEATKQAPMWNFYKYLILPGGKEIDVYSSDIQPDAPEIMRKLKPYLK